MTSGGPPGGSWGGEAVLGRWPSRCNKSNGELVLTASQLVHSRADGLAGGLEVRLRDVTSYLFSRQRSPADKACMQLVTAGSKIIVELTSPSERWKHLKELAEWIRVREEEHRRLGEEQEGGAQRLGAQLRAVLGTPGLSEQYAYLVQRAQVLTPGEFLRAHSQEIATSAPLPAAPAVDLTALSIGIPAEEVGAGKHADMRVIVSEKEAQAVFNEFPALGQLYQAAVPTMLTQAQFWKRCLSSRYYLEATGRKVRTGHPTDPLFDALERPKIQVSQPAAPVVAATADINADLTGDVFRDPEEYHQDRKGSLVARLNERSAGVLAAMMGGSAPPASGVGAGSAAGASARPSAPAHSSGPVVSSEGTADVARAIDRRREALRREAAAVQEDMSTEGPPLKTARLRLRDEVRGGLAGYRGAGDSGPGEEARRALRSWAAEGRAGRTPAAGAPSSQATKSVLLEATHDLVTADRLGRLGHRTEQDGGPEAPRDVVEAMLRAKTLLQHFWASRQSEVDMRSKLVREMSVLVSTIGAWQEDPQSPAAAGRDGVRSEVLSRRGARSFLSPLRRAIGRHERQ